MTILAVLALIYTANDPIEVAPKEKKESIRRISSNPGQTLTLLAEDMNEKTPKSTRHAPKLDGLVDVLGIKVALGDNRIITSPLVDPSRFTTRVIGGVVSRCQVSHTVHQTCTRHCRQ